MDSRALALIPQASAHFSSLRDIIQAMLKEGHESDSGLANFVGAQAHFIGARSQALYHLLQAQYLWDAEIILRSISEASFKALYVCSGSKEARERRLHEFWEAHGAIARLRQSARASEAMRLYSEGDPNRRIFEPMIVGREERKEIDAAWPPSVRKEISRRWSFLAIAQELIKRLESPEERSLFGALLHNYGLSSHMVHADDQALSLIWDRHNRGERERQLLEASHLGRVLSDSLAYLGLVGLAFARASGFDLARMKGTVGSLGKFFQQLDELNVEFHESQDEFYGRVLK